MNDFNALRLKYHKQPEKLWEILQAECRFKTAKKLSETLLNQGFIFPSITVAEMATSDMVADVHASMIKDDETVLDMTCGLGIDTFHIAKRASHVTSIELDHDCFEAALHNCQALNLSNVEIIEGNSVKWLAENDRHYDVIFIDPARRDSSGRHFALRDCQPDVAANLSLLLSRCKRLIIKASPMLGIEAVKSELNVSCQVTVIGTRRECKELVLSIKGYDGANETKPFDEVKCITIGQGIYSFTISSDRLAHVEYSMPAEEGYLYEPFPTVMKGGGYRSLAQEFGVKKLHPNTQLFFSEELKADFPGEHFKIIAILPSSKHTYKEFHKSYPKVNVATRNFPLSAPLLVDKLKVKEGGDKMVFGTTVLDDKKLLIITEMGK
ncbi:MAG: class I SAM-dependent methyltransferase [Duncaniella sp.]|nr:class I SAM-dependent methyltransferase [Muribaculum sp.]MCM1254933.1 class I SAM-dependent methyltransferase [Duncaniella sp.]